MMFAQLSTAKPLIDGGQLRPLGIASKERSAVLPDLPTVVEAGEMPGFEAKSWYALMAPAQTPIQSSASSTQAWCASSTCPM